MSPSTMPARSIESARPRTAARQSMPAPWRSPSSAEKNNSPSLFYPRIFSRAAVSAPALLHCVNDFHRHVDEAAIHIADGIRIGGHGLHDLGPRGQLLGLGALAGKYQPGPVGPDQDIIAADDFRVELTPRLRRPENIHGSQSIGLALEDPRDLIHCQRGRSGVFRADDDDHIRARLLGD